MADTVQVRVRWEVPDLPDDTYTNHTRVHVYAGVAYVDLALIAPEALVGASNESERDSVEVTARVRHRVVLALDALRTLRDQIDEVTDALSDEGEP